MAYYRLYFFDGSGRIRRFREFELQHDLQAVQQAADWRSNEPMELWTGTRMVMRWDRMVNSDLPLRAACDRRKPCDGQVAFRISNRSL